MTKNRFPSSSQVFRIALLVTLLSLFTFPFYTIAMTSLQPVGGFAEDRTPPLIPKVVTLESYRFIIQQAGFLRWFYNSLLVSIITTLVSTSLATLAGYGFSRFQFRSKRFLKTALLLFQMIPGVALIIPYFIMMRTLGLVSTHLSLILAYSSFTQPFCVWMMIGFFDAIPRDLDDCARVDGANQIQAFFRIIAPLTLPGVAATAIFAFVLAWQEYLFSLVLALKPEAVMLPQGLASMAGEMDIFIEPMMAGVVIVSIPIILMFILLERYFVSGLTAGAVKG